MLDIETLRKLNNSVNLRVTFHANQRLVQRNLKFADVVSCINTGEIIEQYENDLPFPSCLILGKAMDGNPMHVCVSHNNKGVMFLLTAYRPNNIVWKEDFKTRRI